MLWIILVAVLAPFYVLYCMVVGVINLLIYLHNVFLYKILEPLILQPIIRDPRIVINMLVPVIIGVLIIYIFDINSKFAIGLSSENNLLSIIVGLFEFIVDIFK